MSAFTDISAALDARTNSLALPTAWENIAFKPTTGTLYIRPTLIPAYTEQAGLGSNGLDEHVGIYQIDIVSTASLGKGEAIIKADVIADHFKRGLVLTYNGVNVRLSKTSRGIGKRDHEAFFTIPIFITYQSFISPR
tara:strand:- start:158 stop:568 length:411 start_codon:yes stop_codon:yes gene_type:complete